MGVWNDGGDVVSGGRTVGRQNRVGLADSGRDALSESDRSRYGGTTLYEPSPSTARHHRVPRLTAYREIASVVSKQKTHEPFDLLFHQFLSQVWTGRSCRALADNRDS